MTKNAYIFSWDQYGIESIIPITEYEHIDHYNLLRILADEKPSRNPLQTIVNNLILRAKYNPQRHYEIYAVDCTEELDVEFWKNQWKNFPQETAELLRDRGCKLYSDRLSVDNRVIT